MIARKARFRSAKKLQRGAGFFLPEQAFHGATMEAILSALDYHRIDRNLREQIHSFYRDFLSCKCKNSPLCGCPERRFTMEILELRSTGLDHRQIGEVLSEEYGIDLYPADILSFLEDSVHVLEAVGDVARLEGASDMAEDAKRACSEISRD